MVNTGVCRQWLASFTAALCMAIAASTFNWLTPITVELTGKDSPIPMSEAERSWVTACTSAGNTISCLPIGIVAHRWGRKPILLLAGPLALLGWILLISTRSLTVLYAVGLIHGYAMATAFCLSSIYIAEIASANIRGALCGQFMTLFYLGTIYVDICAYYASYTVYLYLLALLPIVYTLMLYFMPETPYYLLKSGNDEKAIEVLTWLASDGGMFIPEKFIEIKSSLRKDFYWRNFLTVKQHRKALFIVVSAYVLKCFGGQISLQVFITQILSNVTNNADSILLTTTLNLILCISCFISGFLSDKLGRRPIMWITSLASGLFHLVVSAYFYQYSDNTLDTFGGTSYWILFTSMSLSLMLGNISMSIFLPTVSAEYFTTEARPLGSAIAHTVGGLVTFLSIICYQAIKDNIGEYFNFVIFAFCSFAAAFLIYFLVRETARKTLETIQKEEESIELYDNAKT